MSDELKTTIDEIGRQFEAFKKANDARLAELVAKGHADPLIDAKVDKLSAELSRLDEMKRTIEALEAKVARPPLTAAEQKDATKTEHSKAFGGYVRKGNDAGLRDLERKALNITTDADGAYAVPEVIDSTIDSILVNLSPMRALCNVVSVGTSDYKRLVNQKGTTSGWVGEAAARGETTTPTLAEVSAYMGEIYANPMATQQMLDDVFFDAESWLAGEVAEEFAVEEGDAFVNGSGTSKPKGFLQYTMASTADQTRAWGQIQYVFTGTSGAFRTASATASAVDDFIDCAAKLKQGHRAGASWLIAKGSLATVRKVKGYTGDGYMWQPSIQAGQPSMLLGYPVYECEDMPAVAANAYVAALGDWKKAYTIVDRIGTRILRDPYTNKPYVGFYTTKRVGGMVTNSEAIKIIKLGTS